MIVTSTFFPGRETCYARTLIGLARCGLRFLTLLLQIHRQITRLVVHVIVMGDASYGSVAVIEMTPWNIFNSDLSEPPKTKRTPKTMNLGMWVHQIRAGRWAQNCLARPVAWFRMFGKVARLT